MSTPADVEAASVVGAEATGVESRATTSFDVVRDDPSGLRVRPFRQSDLAVVRDLLRQLGYDIAESELTGRIAGVLEAADHHFVVAEIEGRVAGVLHVFKRPALEKPCEAVVQALVVDAGLRGRGLGRALMCLAEDWARTRGVGSIALHTRKGQAFYESLGYNRIASSDLMRKAL
jgi:N-acetylglutamate synthase-like GNAT family acetyltransferase